MLTIKELKEQLLAVSDENEPVKLAVYDLGAGILSIALSNDREIDCTNEDCEDGQVYGEYLHHSSYGCHANGDPKEPDYRETQDTCELCEGKGVLNTGDFDDEDYSLELGKFKIDESGFSIEENNYETK